MGHRGGDPGRALTKDETINDVTPYRLTNTGAADALLSRFYGENNTSNFTSPRRKRRTSRFPWLPPFFRASLLRRAIACGAANSC
jgi:hypothetical protein